MPVDKVGSVTGDALVPDPIVDGDGILNDGVEVGLAGISDFGGALPELPAFPMNGNGGVIISPGGFLES